MGLNSTTEKNVNWSALAYPVTQIIFDLNHLPKELYLENSEDFEQIINVLIERGYKVILLKEDVEFSSGWKEDDALTHLSIASAVEVLKRDHASFFEAHVFWITDHEELHGFLTENQGLFAYSNSELEPQGLHFEYLRDLLELFHPSHQTALLLADHILEAKRQSPESPLIVGIGGPEDCGQSYFMSALLDVLQEGEFLVEGMDLSELICGEFAERGYWRSDPIENYMMDQVIIPYARGERVIVEQAPECLTDFETNVFPFFLAPEMILLVWGSTLFLPPLQNLIDYRILLELSPRVATARVFGVDEREDFDPEFMKKYLESDGKIYQEYLETNQVYEAGNQLIDFDNFHAFRFKSEQV